MENKYNTSYIEETINNFKEILLDVEFRTNFEIISVENELGQIDYNIKNKFIDTPIECTLNVVNQNEVEHLIYLEDDEYNLWKIKSNSQSARSTIFRILGLTETILSVSNGKHISTELLFLLQIAKQFNDLEFAVKCGELGNDIEISLDTIKQIYSLTWGGKVTGNIGNKYFRISLVEDDGTRKIKLEEESLSGNTAETRPRLIDLKTEKNDKIMYFDYFKDLYVHLVSFKY